MLPGGIVWHKGLPCAMTKLECSSHWGLLRGDWWCVRKFCSNRFEWRSRTGEIAGISGSAFYSCRFCLLSMSVSMVCGRGSFIFLRPVCWWWLFWRDFSILLRLESFLVRNATCVIVEPLKFAILCTEPFRPTAEDVGHWLRKKKSGEPLNRPSQDGNEFRSRPRRFSFVW